MTLSLPCPCCTWEQNPKRGPSGIVFLVTSEPAHFMSSKHQTVGGRGQAVSLMMAAPEGGLRLGEVGSGRCGLSWRVQLLELVPSNLRGREDTHRGQGRSKQGSGGERESGSLLCPQLLRGRPSGSNQKVNSDCLARHQGRGQDAYAHGGKNMPPHCYPPGSC